MPTRHAGPPREVRALDTFIKLMRATERLNLCLSHGLASTGITPGQLAVLEALLHLGTLSQRELARKLLRSDANVTTVVDNLERDGWVRRERSAEDKRVVQVGLTAAGRKKIESVFPAHARRITELLSALSESEQDQLAALCKKLGLSLTER
jgi:MarR family 2-MHQ and catechol resistance regulon transcriptional repressor